MAQGLRPQFTGIRHAAFDVRLHGNLEPDGIWSDGETIWVTHRSGSIEAYRLPTGTATVSQATEADPLTASFASAPETHDGENGFTFRIAFSEDVEITPEDMRDHALLVSGGTVTDAARVKGRWDLWELTVEPAGTGAVSILVQLGPGLHGGGSAVHGGRAVADVFARPAGARPAGTASHQRGHGSAEDQGHGPGGGDADGGYLHRLRRRRNYQRYLQLPVGKERR